MKKKMTKKTKEMTTLQLLEENVTVSQSWRRMVASKLIPYHCRVSGALLTLNILGTELNGLRSAAATESASS